MELQHVTTDENLSGVGSDIVRGFLQQLGASETVALIVRANQLCARYEIDFVEPESENVVSQCLLQTFSYSDTLDELQGFFETVLKTLLFNVGIKVNPEIRFMDLVPLCEALFDLEHHEDSETIVSLLDGGTSPLTQFIDVMAVVVGDENVNFYNDVYHVDAELITNLRALHNKTAQRAADVELPDDMELRDARKRMVVVQALCTLADTRDFVFMQALENGIKIGMPFKKYVQYYLSALVSLEDTALAHELYGFYAISSDVGEELLKAIQSVLELIVDSEIRASKITTAVLGVHTRLGEQAVK